MYVSQPGSTEPLGEFNLVGTPIRYSSFVPRLYNLCKELGMEQGRIMPSRAFCSDENQGYPVILIAKHFGTFPFNHGRVGGIVATDRHGPHAHHGQDMVLIQASHVGYDPQTEHFGTYRRLQTEGGDISFSCGKICSILGWYQEEYTYAQNHVLLELQDGERFITIDNQLLKQDRSQGLFLQLDKLVRYGADGNPRYVRSLSTAKVFYAADELVDKVGADAFPADDMRPIGADLRTGMFFYKHDIQADVEGKDHLELNLARFAPEIVTSASPALSAATVNTQIEFDRTYRTLVKEHAYQGKRLLFVSGLNVDVSPSAGQIFPLTKFIPWAGYVQEPDGSGYTIEQQELAQKLQAQSTENPDQVDLEAAISAMEAKQEILLRVPR